MSNDTDPTDEAHETDLPAGVAEAWGIRERPGRGPRPGLSVQRIVDAAISTALEDGLAAVSMNRVASRLGTAAMSLYRYVSAKEELVALMVDRAQGTPPEPPDVQAGWRAALAHWTGASLAVYHAHPWLVQVPISGPPTLPNGVAWLEQGLRSLTDTPLTEDEKVAVVLLLNGVVRNHATLEAQLAAAMQSPDTADVLRHYGQVLARVTDPERYPALHAALDAGAFDAGANDDLDFDFSLERTLDGIETFIVHHA